MKMFSSLMCCIERSQADLLKVMEEKQKATEKQAEQFISELEQEIIELKKKNYEMEQLLHTQDHLKFLQVRNAPFFQQQYYAAPDRTEFSCRSFFYCTADLPISTWTFTHQQLE